MKSKVLKILTFTKLYSLLNLLCFLLHNVPTYLDRGAQENGIAILLPNTISKKDEKPHTTGPYDTAIPHIKIKVTKILLKKHVWHVS